MRSHTSQAHSCVVQVGIAGAAAQGGGVFSRNFELACLCAGLVRLHLYACVLSVDHQQVMHWSADVWFGWLCPFSSMHMATHLGRTTGGTNTRLWHHHL
mmetsp:Transcript_5047/g.8782  ORF Transcript_5047/g.8782 Transcript_5047/m.8782 type:complete len:99 (-) Transcript_5047:31-327(-)